MTKDLNISQAQLEEALFDQGVTTPSGRTAAQLAAGIWHTLRLTEMEDLLKAARDAYAIKQFQRAADHYAALDSELGEGAPLPGIWGRNDPYEELAKSTGTAELLATAKPLANMPVNGPRPHAWDDITADLGAMQAHLGRVHHIEHEGRSMAGLRAVHNGLHGVDDCGRKLGVSAPGPHAFTEFKDDPLSDAVRWHLENVHEIPGHGMSPEQLKLRHLRAHERADQDAGVPVLGPDDLTEPRQPDRHGHTDLDNPYPDDVEKMRWHLANVHHRGISLATMGPGSLRAVHKSSHRRMESALAGPETALGLQHESMDVRSAMSMLVELSRLQPGDIQRALGYLDESERFALFALTSLKPEEATEHEH